MQPIKIVSISSKRQFTIPKTIRDALGIKPGDKVLLDVRHKREGHYLAIMKAPIKKQE